MIEIAKNKVSPNGGLQKNHDSAMGMKPNLLPEMELASDAQKVETSANTGGDSLTWSHVRNWMECVRDRNQATHAPTEAAYSHSIALIMANAAYRTGQKARSEEHTSELQSLMRISYAVFCLKKKNKN